MDETLIERLAAEAGFWVERGIRIDGGGAWSPPFDDEMKRFAALVAEEAAKLADAQARVYATKRDAVSMGSPRWDELMSAQEAAEQIAWTIRASLQFP